MIVPPVLDCSMAKSWCFEDEKTPHSDEVYQVISRVAAVVPSWFFLEVSNAVVVAERQRRPSVARSSEFFEMLPALDLSILDESIVARLPQILRLAREHQLSTYDAIYLDLAHEIGALLASRDGSLCAAATREGVALFDPSGR